MPIIINFIPEVPKLSIPSVFGLICKVSDSPATALPSWIQISSFLRPVVVAEL